jgi:Ca2+-binding RTX toxin-like protein
MAVDLAKQLSTQSSEVSIINNTSTGRFLNVKRLQEGANHALIAKLDDLFQGDEAKISAYLYGSRDAQGQRIPNGIWDTLSERFVSMAQGDVITLTGGARADGAFAQVELPALLRNQAVTSINGIPTEILRTLRPDQALKLVNAVSDLRASRIGIPVDSQGRPLAQDADVRLDVREFLGEGAGADGNGAAPPASSHQHRRLQEFIPRDRVERHLTALREIRDSLGESDDSDTNNPTLPVLPGRGPIPKGVDRAVRVVDLVLTAEEARRRLADGDRSGAEQVVRDYAVTTAGAVAGARAVSSLVSPLAGLGPHGAVAAGALTLGGALFGANLAGPAIDSFSDTLGRLSVSFTDTITELWTTKPGFLGELSELSESLRRWIDTTIRTLKRLFGVAEATISPLVLDLDGDGVSTLAIEAGLHFDHDGNGFAERSGWVGRGDGLLVRDLNGDGLIVSGAELFGNVTRRRDGSRAPHGFAALAELDANGDGQIDGRDPGWISLRVWVDGDADALTDPGELRSLQELGVRALPLAYRDASLRDAQGNHHRQSGVYRRNDGSERALVDVWFQVDPSQTRQLNPRPVPTAIAVLPDLPGMGNVASLHQTMAADPAGPLVRLIEQWCAADSMGRAALIESILVTWTGVQNRNGEDSSQNAPFRRVLALEQLIGRSFRNTPTTDVPRTHALVELERCFAAIGQEVDLLLTAQYEVAPLVALLQRPQPANGSQRFDVSLVVSALQERQRRHSDPGLLVRMVQAMGRLGDTGAEMLAALLRASEGKGDSLSRILRASARSGVQRQSGSIRADQLLSSTGLDWLEGFEGADQLDSGEGDDVLDGGQGNDRLLGGGGNDLYLIGSGGGDDHILDISGSDDEVHLVGIPADAVRLERHGSDLVVVHASGSARLIHHFQPEWGRIERLSFGDGISWSFPQMLEHLVIGGATAGNDTIGGFNNHSNRIDGLDGNDLLRGGRLTDQLRGGAGHDTLNGADGDDLLDGGSGDDVLHGGDGADTLIGGDGNDSLSGSNGNDLYRITGRSGRQWINNLDDTPTSHDRISFVEISSLDVQAVERRNSDLQLQFHSGGQLTVPFHFASPYTRIDAFHFADGVTWGDQDLFQRIVIGGATAGNDIIGGFNNHSNRIDGLDGNDLLRGGRLTDQLRGGAGHDTINGADGDDLLDGGSGNDVLDGGEGGDTLIGGDGNDSLCGGNGNDLYRITGRSGRLWINNIDEHPTSHDRISFVELSSLDVQAVERRNSDLQLQFHSGGLLTVPFHFVSPFNRIDALHFADGVTWTDQDLFQRIVIGGATAGNDTLGGFNNHSNRIDGLDGNDLLRGGRLTDALSGGAGHDTLNGADGDDLLDGGSGNDVLDGGEGGDTLIGGDGNDSLSGGNGNDLYRITGRSGRLWINNMDENPTSHDRISFAELSSLDLRAVERRNSDLQFQFHGGGQLTVPFHFASPYTRIDAFHFADGVSWGDQELRQRLQTPVLPAPLTTI